MPGLVNAHVHTYLSPLRGLADDLPSHRWITERIHPFEHVLDAGRSFVAALSAVAEKPLTGTTAMAAMCYHPRVTEVLNILGIKGLVSNVRQDGLLRMRLVALLSKAMTGDVTVLPASLALAMATNATAIGFDGGQIQSGWAADITVLDTEKMTMVLLLSDPISNLAFSANGR